MRKNQVISLLDHCKRDLDKIEVEYSNSLESKQISDSLKIDIKNFMENLRSILDYLAHDIYDIHIQPYRTANGKNQIDKIYFPYGKTKNVFKSSTGSSLPELDKINPNLYSILGSIQSYTCGDSWLYDFCNITNQKKHNSLTPQEREEQKGLNIQFPGGASINMGPGSLIKGSGMISCGNDRMILDGDVISGDFPAQNIQGNVKQTIVRWVSFKFANTDIIVLPFLKRVYSNIDDLVNQIYKIL